MLSLAFLLPAVLFVAYANGANDNFKGAATLLGSGTSSYRGALAWATFSTFAGSLAALLLSERLLARFSGRGLVPDALVGDPGFVGAIALAAALTVILATLLAFPISTTHALTGALVGAGLVQGEVRLEVLGAAFFLPLVASPLLALLLALILYPTARRLRARAGIRSGSCVCLNQDPGPAAATPDGAAATGAPTLHLVACPQRTEDTVAALTARHVLDGAHYLSAGAVSFARGLNDTPKIVALLVTARALDLRDGMLLVGLAMALGAIVQARKVADTMSHRITRMDRGQGFCANLVTASLVILASRYGLPVSTTHVSCGSLFGIGAATRQAEWRTVGSLLLAWGVTLPVAACLGACVFGLLRGPGISLGPG